MSRAKGNIWKKKNTGKNDIWTEAKHKKKQHTVEYLHAFMRLHF